MSPASISRRRGGAAKAMERPLVDSIVEPPDSASSEIVIVSPACGTVLEVDAAAVGSDDVVADPIEGASVDDQVVEAESALERNGDVRPEEAGVEGETVVQVRARDDDPGSPLQGLLCEHGTGSVVGDSHRRYERRGRVGGVQDLHHAEREVVAAARHVDGERRQDVGGEKETPF